MKSTPWCFALTVLALSCGDKTTDPQVTEDAGHVAAACERADDCLAGEFCDLSLTPCSDGGNLAVLASGACRARPCESTCVGMDCASHEDCMPGEFCDPDKRCADTGSCTLIVECPDECSKIREPHRYCEVCLCPSCP